MFRWLALCVVLCAGAFALVALATGKFLPSKTAAEETAAPAVETTPADDVVQRAPGGQGGDHGAIVLPNARLEPIEREDVPFSAPDLSSKQNEGTLRFVGTDVAPADPARRAKPLHVRVYFPVVRIWERGLDGAPPAAELQSKGIALVPVGDSNVAPPQAVSYSWWVTQHPIAAPKPMDAGNAADAARPAERPEDAVYRRWKTDDQLQPHTVKLAFEDKDFYELKEGDWVNQDQLVALVDTTAEVTSVAIAVTKLETAESEYLEAGKTKQEAERRAKESQRLYELHTGVISLDAYYADLLNAARYAEEERGKLSARQEAVQELNAALILLNRYEVHTSIPGVIKTIYKHPGEAVKNLDPIVHVDNPLKLRAEALAGVQDAENLRDDMTVIVQPTQPVPPLAPLYCSQAEVTCVAVSRPTAANGHKIIVSGSEDGVVRFWDASAVLAVSGQKKEADPKKKTELKLQDPRLAQLDQHAGVLAVACTGPKAAGNLALIGGRDGVGRLIDLDRLPAPAQAGQAAGDDAVPTLAPPQRLSERHRGPISCVAFSPDGTICATGGEDRAIRLWKVADGQLILTLNGAHKAAVTSVQFADPDGKSPQLVSAGGDYALVLWKLENFDNLDGDKTKKAPTAMPSAVLPYRSGDVARPGVSADGKHLLFDHGNELRVLSLDTRRLEGVIQGSGTGASFTTMAVFSPDGATVLTNSASDGRLQLWRTPPARIHIADDQTPVELSRALELRQFTASSSNAATCGAFDPDAKPTFVVTGSRDGYILVWKMPDAAEVQRDPKATKLNQLDRSLEAGARQMRVQADLPEMKSKQEWLDSKLTPGGTATLVIPPGQ
ncbi:MAG TPA: hypothetical protein VMS17_28865 [Gemmataceae bacterium]|nr:hypothetical protein [Gemmataceae bacterium]